VKGFEHIIMDYQALLDIKSYTRWLLCLTTAVTRFIY